MPGTIVFKPIEANLNHDSDLIGKADPYCMFLVGDQKIKGQVCKSGGKHPIWQDAVTVQPGNQTTCFLEIKDKDILKDDKLGTCEIDLREIESQGRLKKWYPIFYKNKPAGEILMEATFSSGGFGQGVPFQGQGMPIQTQGMPIQTQGMPMQSYGMPIQSQGVPLEQHILVGGAPIGTNMTQVHTKETIISGGPMGTQYGNPNLIQGQPYGPGVIPSNMYQSNYSQMNESYSDQYAREALIRGVDPLGTHLHNYPGGNLPPGNPTNLPGAYPGGNLPLGNPTNLPGAYPGSQQFPGNMRPNQF